eukprot:s30_g7.t1
MWPQQHQRKTDQEDASADVLHLQCHGLAALKFSFTCQNGTLEHSIVPTCWLRNNRRVEPQAWDDTVVISPTKTDLN